MKVKTEFKLRDLTTAELADLYGRPERSFRDWISRHKEKIGKKKGRWWDVKQVIIIMQLRGPIGATMIDEEEI